jgi:hypothetical protein
MTRTMPRTTGSNTPTSIIRPKKRMAKTSITPVGARSSTPAIIMSPSEEEEAEEEEEVVVVVEEEDEEDEDKDAVAALASASAMVLVLVLVVPTRAWASIAKASGTRISATSADMRSVMIKAMNVATIVNPRRASIRR